MNAGKLKSMEFMEFCRHDYDNYLGNNHLAPYLVQLVATTNWTLDWHSGASAKVSPWWVLSDQVINDLEVV